MRDVPISDLIGKSVNRTQDILFRPFKMKRWLKFLLIALLAGALGGGFNGGGGGGSGSPATQTKPAAQEQVIINKTSKPGEPAQDAEKAQSTTLSEELSPQLKTLKEKAEANQETVMAGARQAGPDRFVFFSILAIIGILALVLFILGTWVSSRFKFVWFNAVAHRLDVIAEPFTRYRGPGNSLFGFNLLFFGAALLLFVGLVAWLVVPIASQGEAVQTMKVPQVLGLVLPQIAALVLLIVFFSVIGVYVEDFVVPVMALENCRFGEAWSKTGAIFRAQAMDFTKYFAVKILLGLVTGVLQLIFAVIILIFIVLAGLVLFLLPFGLAKAASILPVYFVYAVIVGVPSVLVFLTLILSVGLPFAVFYRSFSLYFLSSLRCGYTPLDLS